MPTKYPHRFCVKLDRAFGFHIGLAVGCDPPDYYGRRDIYLSICLGWWDLFIGLLTDLD